MLRKRNGDDPLGVQLRNKLVGVCNCRCHCGLTACITEHEDYCEHCAN